jgi:hypothetical protein
MLGCFASEAGNRRRFRAVFTGVKLVYPWGRHFLHVCLQSFVRLCKRKKFQGSKIPPTSAAGNSTKGAISAYGGAFPSFLMTYERE